MSCTVCESQQAKYKCPKCLAKYCSVACCKEHKANSCTVVEKTEEISKPVTNNTANSCTVVEKTEEISKPVTNNTANSCTVVEKTEEISKPVTNNTANSCTVVEKTEEISKPVTNNTEMMEMQESEDFVHPDKLAQLGESEEVKALLCNPHLRAMMVDLVNSEDPEEDMSLAMHEPIFLELASACLKVVEGDKHDDAAT